MKKCFASVVVFAAVLFSSQISFSKIRSLADLHTLGASQEDFHYNDYYTIKEDPRVAVVNLMDFNHLRESLPLPTEAYDRAKQFGGWINYPGDNLCLNTRNKVLVRDSKSTVTYTPDSCAVQSGQWDDPYSGRELNSPKQIQIDHLVPLKNAYMTGAFEWDKAKRCLYGNYLGNNFHLLPVSSHENLVKGDNTPNNYMPPDHNYTCQYIKHWLQVKVIWGLRVTPQEFSGLQREFEDEKCDRGEFKMTAAELTEQRRFMEENKDLCQGTKRNSQK